MRPEINFINEKVKFSLKGKKLLKQWIRATIEKEKHALGSICYIFCSDQYLLELNKGYLNHAYYTDILTFDYSEPIGKNKKKIICGDLFISIDRVNENSKSRSVTFENELKRVMIHGVLHLMGYKDKKLLEKKEMRKKENIYLVNFV